MDISIFCGLTLSCLGFLLTVQASQALAQETKAKIRISYPSVSIANLALFAAPAVEHLRAKRA